MLGGFTSIYPWLSFSYFIVMFLLSLLFKHPIYLTTLFIASILLIICLHQTSLLKKQLKFYLFMSSIIIILNPLFVGRGSTILFYIGYHNITLESFIYGILFALSLLNVMFFFLSYNAIISPQKFLYLFANIIPYTAFIISVTMRFIPLFKRRMQEIIEVKNTFSPLCDTLSLRSKLKQGMDTLNTLVSWTLEESLENAISMRARGYGLFKRTSSISYAFTQRDLYFLIGFILTLLPTLVGFFLGYGQFQIYPSLGTLTFSAVGFIHYLCFTLLSLLPIIIEVREYLKWQSIN